MRAVSTPYAKSMKWFLVYMAAVTVGMVCGLASTIANRQLTGETLNLVVAIFGTIPQVLLLYTGYSFKKETEQ